MKRLKLRKSAKLAGLAAIMAAAATPALHATVNSDVVTASKYTQPAGPNFFGIVAHPAPLFTGSVVSVVGNVITINGTLTAGALNSILIDGTRDTAQYVVKLRHDRTGDGDKNEGSWFLIAANTGTTVTVAPNALGGAADSLIAAGDIVQIEKLPTLQDAWGSGAGVLVDQDNNFDDASGDTIYTVSGTGFSEAIVYHDGSLVPAGWYDVFSGLSIGDGSTFTFAPDQAVFSYNNYGPAYDVTLKGNIQCFALSHFILPGFNGITTGFAASAPLGAAGLFLPPVPGSTFKAESNFDDSSDALYSLIGTGFDKALIYHDGSLLTQGWYDAFGGTPEATFPLTAGTGYYVKNTGAPYIWHEPKP